MTRKPTQKTNTWRERHNSAAQLGLIHLAVAVLGHSMITMHGRTHYTVHGVDGTIHYVHLKDGAFTCSQCAAKGDVQPRDAALVRLYIEALTGASPTAYRGAT